MNRFLYIIFLMLSLCNSKELIQDKDRVLEIVVNYDNITYSIKNRERIATICNCINKSRREPVKFIPNVILKLKRELTQDTFFITENFLSDNSGIKYYSDCNIEEQIMNFLNIPSASPSL
jgi:uncharacterized protein YllA (UPF0747 family)